MASHLASVLPSELLPWRNALRPVKQHLTGAADGDLPRRQSRRSGSRLCHRHAGRLPELTMPTDCSTCWRMPVKSSSAPSSAGSRPIGNEPLNSAMPKSAKRPGQNASDADKEALAMRQANAAVMLLKMDAAEQVWPLLRHSPDPRVRSYIIHWLSPRGGRCQPDPRPLRTGNRHHDPASPAAVPGRVRRVPVAGKPASAAERNVVVGLPERTRCRSARCRSVAVANVGARCRTGLDRQRAAAERATADGQPGRPPGNGTSTPKARPLWLSKPVSS